MSHHTVPTAKQHRLASCLLVLALALVAGCAAEPEPVSSAADRPASAPTEEPIDTPAGEDRDPLAEPDAPAAPREVPPLNLPAQAPGSDQAYDALIADLSRLLDEGQEGNVPWPDSRNPDPVAAYQSSAAFQNWMSENNPTPTLAEAYTAPGSPERGWDVSMFASQRAQGLLSTPSVPPYQMRVEDLVHPAATGITDALLEQIPEGSAAVVYWDSVGTSSMVDENGVTLYESTGWSDLGPWVAIMAPTDTGWRVWWDELTDPPPPPPTVEVRPDPRRDA